MGVLIQVLPLIIQLAEALLGRGKGKQKLDLATALAQKAMEGLARNGIAPEADAHEVGFIQSKIHETVEAMRADGRLDEGKPVLIDEGKPFKSIPAPPVNPQAKLPFGPFGGEVDFSQI